ncbi:endothelin-1 [Synchiropus splendidus]|uniref:endothelin-1 n=1 Tax=Synchiropus splendidus TaxID=270530 RepID=UPI00237E7364|nr:endothelin-1 [Synchiropus splendidus]
MDLYFFISLVSLAHTGIFSTVLSAPTAETPPESVPHVRTKRCSCTTFLDTECVYFCHLDIIWVNTPERVVSYGLGNAPRTRRAIQDSPQTRCRCLRRDDDACSNFCLRPRSEASPHKEVQSTHRKCFDPTCRHELGAGTRTMRRVWSSSKSQLPLQTLRVAVKWRQHHRTRAREGESGAS